MITAKRVRELIDSTQWHGKDWTDVHDALCAYADSLERPCMDREPPHCPSCNCGAPDELKKGDL